jgi:D-sedoheptulose 7-phosphate isomerase
MPLNALIRKYPELKFSQKDIENAVRVIARAFASGRKLLLCGNGGSASDCEHISGEFLKGFMSKRPLPAAQKKNLLRLFGKEGRFMADRLQQGFPAIPMVSFSALNTAFANDVAPELCFAQMVNALGLKGDVFLGLSTSGNAKNVIYAAMAAKAKGLITIGLTGRTGGRLKEYCDITVRVPGDNAPTAQEYHLPVYHAICMAVEKRLIKS